MNDLGINYKDYDPLDPPNEVLSTETRDAVQEPPFIAFPASLGHRDAGAHPITSRLMEEWFGRKRTLYLANDCRKLMQEWKEYAPQPPDRNTTHESDVGDTEG